MAPATQTKPMLLKWEYVAVKPRGLQRLYWPILNAWDDLRDFVFPRLAGVLECWASALRGEGRGD